MRHFNLSGIFAGTTLAMAFLAVSPAQADTRYNFRVDGITCPFCVATSEKALKNIKGVKSVSTNLKAGIISVCAAPSVSFSNGQMRSLFSSKGFTFKSMNKRGSC